MSENVREITVEEAKQVLVKAVTEEQKAQEQCRDEVNGILAKYGFILVPKVEMGIMKGEFNVTWDFMLLRKKKDDAIQHQAS